jgi:hypothetical protein
MVRVMVAAASAWLMTAVAIVAAVLVTAAVARARGRRLERRMLAELGARWEPMTERPPVEDGDLRISLEELLTERDALLEEFQAVQAQITVLKRRAERRRPVAAVADDGADPVIQLHEVLPEEWAERRRR